MGKTPQVNIWHLYRTNIYCMSSKIKHNIWYEKDLFLYSVQGLIRPRIYKQLMCQIGLAILTLCFNNKYNMNI